ncbi:MAG: tRNA (pseudouridine(54)-N(1))-methyltransferase TrmY [Candidatus Aenigmarchaeota archaeon]|nr:tRNA (pseudouridine(54)-N(1))-methyltransferase TrmY [Candidatus Aenigmarchaeota archaeon]MDW8149535.1 tRNA (pseudouridine(54)-N(1))-methyltransferase TrmY [Candidatus Aenigmarchaeota archaeon]
MVEFLVRMNNAITTPNFSLNSLVNAGRMDIACRCISNAIFLSYSIRKNVKIYINLNGPPNPPVTICFDSNNLKNVTPDERNIGSHIRIALKKVKEDMEMKSEPGITVSKKSFEELIKEKSKNNFDLYYLTKNGKDIRNFEFGENSLFILGDHKGIPKKTEIFLEKFVKDKISLGKIEYLASACISIVHYEIDRKKY